MKQVSSHLELVREFMTAADQTSAADIFNHFSPTTKEKDLVKLRLKLLLEEVSELYEAILNENSFQEFEVYFQKLQDLTNQIDIENLDIDIVEVADATTDIEYINNGNAVAFNIPLDETFEEVHLNNMTKVDPVTKKCLKNEFGKILKPVGYIPPDLSKFFN